MPNDKIDFYSTTNIKSYNLNDSMRYQLAMLDNLDNVTRKHSENVANLTCRVCEYLHSDKSFTIYATICAYLHDIGKMYIPPAVLQKPGKLTEEEYTIMKTHTTIGYKMCMQDLKLRPYAAGPLYHHESLNGTGYPQGLTKKDIPYVGQVIRVCDEFDAIVAKRQYKTHISISDTLKILKENCDAGKINPKPLKALFKVVIDDTLYEISGVIDYIEFLHEQINRLEKIQKWDIRRKKAKKEKEQNYYAEGMKLLFQDGEDFDNYESVITDYKDAIIKKEEEKKKLFEEVKKIKKLKV